jgi:ERCC4-type nuclease
MGLDVETTTLEFSDVCFNGRGDNDVPVFIGIELKKLPDLVSSLRTGRISGHQGPGLTGENSPFQRAWLLVEGEYRTSSRGLLTVPRFNVRMRKTEWAPLHGSMTTAEMEKRVHSLELCGGLHTRFTNTRNDTLHFIANLYRWWTDTTMDRHDSHLAPHTPQGFITLSDFRQTVMVKFPHIGRAASKAVEDYFGASLQDACNASAADWAEIVTFTKEGKPRRLGAKAAADITQFVRGKKS